MRFIDLFAGLGGFHLALKRLGHVCVFACELDETLRSLYAKNFGLECTGDIRKLDISDVPEHEILCAGFPCQPFSKAGAQPGFAHPELGVLYEDILRIVRARKPQFLILENVPNLERHDEGRTWNSFDGLLRAEGYDIKKNIFSPHHFGIPQIRERVYIVGSRGSLETFKWPSLPKGVELSISSVLDADPADAKAIPDQVSRCLDIWQDFLDRIPKHEKVPHPLWAMEFGATYPYENTTPQTMRLKELTTFKGSFGASLVGMSKAEALSYLPSHARRRGRRFPAWKVEFIRKNRDFYARHASWLDKWMKKIVEFPSSFQKLEWNCQGDSRIIRDNVVQIRASGVRVKRPTTAPSLVAMTSTQVPIITWEGRYMTPDECKRLQSMEDLRFLPERSGKAYEALGNAINVDVASQVAAALLKTRKPSDRRRSEGSTRIPRVKLTSVAAKPV